MKALQIALISGVISLLSSGCSGGGAMPAAPLQIAPIAHAPIARHHGKGPHMADCPADSGGVTPGELTC